MFSIMASEALRCLDDMTLMSARVALSGHDAVRIPYICQVSGRSKELLLISRDVAERMVVATKGMIDVDEARVLALLHMAQICETDLPELLRMPGQKVKDILSDLAHRGLADAFAFEDIHYYRQAPGDIHTQFTDLVLGAFHA